MTIRHLSEQHSHSNSWVTGNRVLCKLSLSLQLFFPITAVLLIHNKRSSGEGANSGDSISHHNILHLMLVLATLKRSGPILEEINSYESKITSAA